jgi:hypothetical protein
MQHKAPADMPEYLREMIENDTFKDQPKEFQDRILNSLKAIATGESSPEVAVASEFIREEFEKSRAIAKAANLLCGRIEEYVVREWKT